MAQQTALQFFLMGLIDLEIGKGVPTNKQVELHKLFEQAKQMEKEQIMNAFENGIVLATNVDYKSEEYYNETYSKSQDCPDTDDIR